MTKKPGQKRNVENRKEKKKDEEGRKKEIKFYNPMLKERKKNSRIGWINKSRYFVTF